MNRDTVVGVVGCVVLIAAMVGVFTYERVNAQAAFVPDADTPASTLGPTLTGTVALGETHAQVANVNATSARNVTFHLTWTAANGRDTLRITVSPSLESGIPEGASSEPSDSGEITLTVPVPEGATPQGPWEVQVQFVSAAPDALPGGVPPPVPPPGSTDASVDYSVAVTLS